MLFLELILSSRFVSCPCGLGYHDSSFLGVLMSNIRVVVMHKVCAESFGLL